MRISDVQKVTGIPMATLKDLRHRSILELASAGFPGEPEEIRRWGNFSAPSVICIMGADEVRKLYGLSWQDAMVLVRTALDDISIQLVDLPGSAKFFDLAAVKEDIWAGRFDFQFDEPALSASWNYFSGRIEDIPSKLVAIKAVREEAHARLAQCDFTHERTEHNDVASCIMINASRLCRDFFASAKKHNALRDTEGEA